MWRLGGMCLYTVFLCIFCCVDSWRACRHGVIAVRPSACSQGTVPQRIPSKQSCTKSERQAPAQQLPLCADKAACACAVAFRVRPEPYHPQPPTRRAICCPCLVLLLLPLGICPVYIVCISGGLQYAPLLSSMFYLC